MKRVLGDRPSAKPDCPVSCKRSRVHERSVKVGDRCDITTRKKFARNQAKNSHKCANGNQLCCPPSLVQLSAKVAAANVPFQLVEERYIRIPEPVVRQFITWSFPRNEADVRRYSALSCASCDNLICKNSSVHDRVPQSPSNGRADSSRLNAAKDSQSDVPSYNSDSQDTFRLGATLAEAGAVQQPMQIGFHLSGVISETKKDGCSSPSSCHTSSTRSAYNVAVTFDRCKVTSSSCDCEYGDGIFFCCHVVALLLFRMRHPEKVKLRSPISDTLQQLNRDQLQKLAQYLLSRHSSILPTAQEIADHFDDPLSSINAVHGAPDPTAGAGFQDEDRWSLNERHVSEYVRKLLFQPNKQTCPNQVYSMLGKVREMMRVRDCNGARLLTLITRVLLRQGGLINSQQNDVFGRLWDQISLLWICVVLNPRIEISERDEVLKQLHDWNRDPQCPPEDVFSESFVGQSRRTTSRSVLSRAIDAGSLRWDDSHLRFILVGDDYRKIPSSGSVVTASSKGGFAKFSSDGKPLWHENPPMACARVEALRSHGYTKEAVRLARAVARTIRENAVGNFTLYKTQPHQDGVPATRNNGYGLVGDPLNPIHILLDALTSSDANACGASEQGSLQREAIEVCLLGIGEQRSMPAHARAQEKVLSCEKVLIDQLKKLKLDKDLLRVLRDVSVLLIEGGPASGLGKRIHRESVPMHAFATYLFKALLPYDRDLAFRVGLRAMRMPILDENSGNTSVENNRGQSEQRPDHAVHAVPGANYEPAAARDDAAPVHAVAYHFPTLPFPLPSSWSVMRDLELNQYTLAAELLQTAKGEVMTLGVVVDSIQRHIRNGSHVFQLSHDAFKSATLQGGAATPDSTMLNVAMELAMQVLKMTMRGGFHSRRRTEMVGWLVTCATEIGLVALVSIIKAWYTLFSPIEACTMVAGCVVSPNTAMRLNLDPRQREELFQCICQMAVQCAVKDPQGCALCALNLCESFPSAFDAVYHVVIDAANKRRIDSAQLYTTARYLDQRGYHARAFAVTLAATKRLRVAFNHDVHPAANDLLWSTQLAQSLGMQELEDLVNVIVSKVSCASVLSDVLRTCTSTISGRLSNCGGNYRGLRADRAPLRPLLEASIAAYISTIHNKLSHISPRHYAEFIDFLNKARETFLLAPDGPTQFGRLLADLRANYKGKKKLLNLVASRFFQPV